MPSSSYTLLEHPEPRPETRARLPGAEELGRVYQPTLAIQATPGPFCDALAAMPGPQAARPRREQAAAAHAEYLDWSETPDELPGRVPVRPGAVVWLRDRLPADAIICNGAGNFTIWIHRYYRFRAFGTQLAPTSGSMGYGPPRPCWRSASMPERIVVAFAGDGDFLMNGQEFATAVQYGIPIIVIVLDNGMYGTIRMHQEREYPGRVSATQLKNPDFAALARSYGGHGERVERTEDVRARLRARAASGKPAILHCIVDPQALTPTMTLDAIRARALQQDDLERA